jgi:hypothetical protein
MDGSKKDKAKFNKEATKGLQRLPAMLLVFNRKLLLI